MDRQQLLPLANAVSAVVTPTRAWPVRHRAFRAAGIRLAPGAVINGGCRFYGPNVEIGSSWIGLEAWLISTQDAAVTIGDGCDIGPQLLATVGTHDVGPPSRRAGADRSIPVRIEDGCWIGARVTILPGVTIGRSSVVAAGAVVTKSTAPGSLVAGVPARLIRTLHDLT